MLIYLMVPILFEFVLFLISSLVDQDTRNWPLIAPLPSYGRGRERPGGRYMSFIHGDGIHDVVITGRFQPD